MAARQTNGSTGAVLDALAEIVQLVQPQKLLYLAIDGVPPRLKERLQRERRQIQKDSASRGVFDSSVITPGTPWMHALEEKLRGYLDDKKARDWRHLRVVFSGSRDPGEGEQKIMEYLRRRQGGRHVVWSNDADSVLLALATHVPQITLVGERKRDGISSFAMVEIDRLRKRMLGEYAPKGKCPERVMDDLVFLTLLVGNDFLPAMQCTPGSSRTTADGAIDALWRAYGALDGYLCEDGRISPGAFAGLLEEFVRDYEEKQFRRHIGATYLGSQAMAVRAQRVAWDGQRKWLPERQQTSVEFWHAPAGEVRPKGKKRARNSGRHGRPQRTLSGLPLPYVWAGCIGEVLSDGRLRQVSELPEGRPLALGVHPKITQLDGSGQTLLTLEGRLLVSPAMLPLFNRLARLAADEQCEPVVVRVDGDVSQGKIEWLQALAQALGYELRAYGPGDSEYGAAAERGRQGEGLESLSLADAGGRWTVIEMRQRDAVPGAALAAAHLCSGAIAVVGEREWDVLLNEAQVDGQLETERAGWKSTIYWRGKHVDADFIWRLSDTYARALGWTAEYCLAGRVPSWEFSWPADLESQGMAPLPSDMLEYMSKLKEWPVPQSDSLPPVQLEHLLSVMPQEQWTSFGEAERRLAAKLRKSKYSDSTRQQLRDALADTAEAASAVVYIWL
ncbi:hypothetical protein GGF46_001680 [Coemansia sp. RSA 552]|nr:hypothetical protein GGF46_001680 [Coemansia sp. RSA 552]